MNFTRYELHRRTTKSGAFSREVEYQVHGANGEILYTGTSSGRFLSTSAVFRDAGDAPVFTITANRKIAPNRWTLRGSDDQTLASFKASSVKRGATEITLATGEVYCYKQADSIIRDYLKATVLLDTGAFVLLDQDKVIADSSAAQDPRYAEKSLLGRLSQVPSDIASSVVSLSRNEFYRSESIRVYDGWTPRVACMPAAIMLFKDEVIEQIRRA